MHQDDEAYVLVLDRAGEGQGHLGHAQAHVSRLCKTFNELSCVARVLVATTVSADD